GAGRRGRRVGSAAASVVVGGGLGAGAAAGRAGPGERGADELPGPARGELGVALHGRAAHRRGVGAAGGPDAALRAAREVRMFRASTGGADSQAGRKAAGETPKNLASLTTCALVRDRVPFRTAETVDCAIPADFASFGWLRPLARINSRSTSASEASGIETCSSS